MERPSSARPVMSSRWGGPGEERCLADAGGLGRSAVRRRTNTSDAWVRSSRTVNGVSAKDHRVRRHVLGCCTSPSRRRHMASALGRVPWIRGRGHVARC
jgi:hypothetical protein